ncbi:ThuA domain-containing protein [Roseiconus nitratireducens]|uniref:ThuA domain-containing protein n=1 Tax=Roseiconus nitratireducens TaxID=2605748 RepID=A0A5M6CYF2_9BACT|nr:ThuA domain-containing protein [Roseiconus nitratireducens]KAA5540231.1 ThuA domain-containing protein [Roseiconus nitratireducens]
MRRSFLFSTFLVLIALIGGQSVDASADDARGTLQFKAPEASRGHIVLVAGDEEYRSEEVMPMLAKILSQRHGFDCTVLFAMSADGSYIDPNNSSGVLGWEALDDADLMIIGTRFRTPDDEQAGHITEFINAGKPVIGVRTATHAFTGGGKFGSDLPYGKFGRMILGEEWVNHHGQHKRQGARGVIAEGQSEHPVLNSVSDIFVPSDVYGVTHLSDDDTILLRAAVTESLDPKSKNVEGAKNDPMQPFAWLHTYVSPDGTEGKAFCTTAGASVDFVNEDLRRLVVNAAYYLTGHDVPQKADVRVVDPFYPTFFGFIREDGYYKDLDLQPSDFALGKSPSREDPKGSPEWNFRDRP